MNASKALSTSSTDLTLQPESVTVTFLDTRSDALSVFEATAEDRRTQLAEDAWVVGLRALKNAYAQAQDV